MVNVSDIFLAGSTSLSRRAVRRLVGSGGVWAQWANPCGSKSKPLETGDVVDVLLPCDELGVPATPDLPMPEILFEDRWLGGGPQAGRTAVSAR